MQEASGLHETFAWCSAHPALHFQSHACRTQPERNVEFWNPRNSVATCVLCVGYLHSLSFTHYPQLWLSGLVQIHYTKNWSEFHVRRQSWHLGPRNMKTPRQANIDFVVAQPPNRRSKSSLNLGQKRKENSYPPIPSLKLTGGTWKIGRKPPKGKEGSNHQFSGAWEKSFREGTPPQTLRMQRHNVACEEVALVSSKTHLFHWAWLGRKRSKSMRDKNVNHVIENRFKRPQIQLT